MNKMFVKELYEKRNLATSRISKGLVWTRRTKNGKDIRISNPHEITHELVPWGAYAYFLEDNKCWLEETNCKKCEKLCWPNACFDFDPGQNFPKEKLINFLMFVQKDLENEGIVFNLKHTGGRGYNIDVFTNDFKPPESGKYIPLKILKHHQEMSVKQMKQTINELTKDPFEVTRDYIRMKTDHWRALFGSDLVHDMSIDAWDLNSLTVDASSVKRRSYHRAYYSLTDNKTACLPVCRAGEKLTKELAQRIDEISKKPFEITSFEKELPDIEVKLNDSTFIRDFIEENEHKIYGDLYERCIKKLYWIA